MLPQPLSWDRTKARAGAFDGHFLVGVLSTGIYCLPSCAARPPKPENVRVVASEADAQILGLRACKRCRPDLFYRGENSDAALFAGLVLRVRKNLSSITSVAGLARMAGIGASKLESVMRIHANETPANWLRRERVKAAQRLLRSSDQRVTDIALAVGYKSESAFYRQFVQLSKTTPARFRAGK